MIIKAQNLHFRLSLACALVLCEASGLDLGYNSECQMDSECRASTDLKDVCCALLIYEANDVIVKKRECLPRSTMEDAGGSYEFEGVTTTDAYCDRASMLTTMATTAIVSTFLYAML